MIESGHAFERITFDPSRRYLQTLLRHLRFPVSRLLGLLAARESRESILSADPYLEEADIDEAPQYAAMPFGRRDDRVEAVRFSIDLPLSPELAQWLCAEGHDRRPCKRTSMNSAPDTEILSTAAKSDRVVITAIWTFPETADLVRPDRTDPLRGGNYSEAESRDCVRRVLISVAHTELPSSIVVVDRERIRRRWLPI